MNLFVPLILTGILVIIALLLIAAERAFGSSGERILAINDDKKFPLMAMKPCSAH
jgi:hypothetical protein